jgi:membrane protease YdiL (CAAX protease family)
MSWSREKLDRGLPLLAPLGGLMLLTTLAVLVPEDTHRMEGLAFVRATLFELKVAHAAGSAGAAGKDLAALKGQLAEVLAEVPAEQLEAPARRFLGLALVLLGRGEKAADVVPPSDPAREWIADLGRGRTPTPPGRFPDVGVRDAWLDARVALAVAETRAGLPDAERNRLKERAFRAEREQLERMGGFVGLIFLLFAGGTVFLARLRPLLERARTAQSALFVPRPRVLDGATAWRLGLGWLAAHLGLSLLLPPLLVRLPGVEGPVVPALVTYFASAAVGLALLVGVAFPRRGLVAVTLPDLMVPAEGMELTTGWWALGGLAAALVLVVGASMLRLFLPENDLLVNPGVRTLLLLGGRPERLVFLVSVALVAPVFEEALFRGFVFAQLRHRLGLAAAASTSAALFALVHFSLGSFLPLFALGLVLAWAYEATGNLATPMLIHAAWNAGTAMVVMSVVL